mgnify:FL=1
MQKLQIFYREEQTVKHNPTPDNFNYPVFSPSAGKPKLVVEDYLSSGLAEYVCLNDQWEPLTRQDIYLSHRKSHVDNILDCKTINGFGNKSKEVSDSLPFTNGSFVRASFYAYENKTNTMSPTSGFHHSGYSSSEGFCTFNGLMIAAIKLKKETNICKIGIVDYDAHWGNGTDNIINVLGIDYISHISLGKAANLIHRKKLGSNEWVKNIKTDLEKNISDCELIMYQAGADPHINDPYGQLLTTEQMFERDMIVFQFAKDHNIPIVWNLAGGYQEPIQKVLDLHMNTLIAYTNVFCQ